MKNLLSTICILITVVSLSETQYNNLFSHLVQKQNPMKVRVGRRVALTVSIDGRVLKDKIEIGLFDGVTPITANNFYQLCVNQFYDDIPFHRIINDFVIQGGDFTRGDGRGGHAFKYKPSDPNNFDDENFLVKHAPFVLSMANSGPNTNGSQFFITLRTTKWLDGKHTVFGRVLKGKKVAKEMESFGSRTGKTSKPVRLVKCEEIKAPKKKAPVASDGHGHDESSGSSHRPKSHVHFDPIRKPRRLFGRQFNQGIPIQFSSIRNN